MLAHVLSNQLRQPVADTTDINGVFDFTPRWRPDCATSVDDDRSSLFTAIHEQLGLRLVSRKATVDIVVVDRLTTAPTDN